jgi:hypothetical protein
MRARRRKLIGNYSIIARQRAKEMENTAKPVVEKHFLDMTKEEQEKVNHYDLREMALYYGSWDNLRKVIDELEQNDAESAYDRAYSRD